MIWLSSFPRSGNTFFRNILFEVYGIETSTFHRESTYPLDPGFLSYPLVKTHELPSTLEEFGANIPAVYLVRDGRDAVCSIAHHRSDLIAPGSDYYQNLKEAIIADGESFFGGWSRNAEEWLEKADLIIRYEDLIKDPLGTVERIRKIFDLPEPDRNSIPTFEDLKNGIAKYGAGRDHLASERDKRAQAQKFFRRGKAGCWKDEMPEELHDLFWSYHGDMMEKYGYSLDGKIQALDPDFDNVIAEKLGAPPLQRSSRPYKVLIESAKIVSADNDGVKRYQVDLMRALLPAVGNSKSRWDIDLYIQNKVVPLEEAREYILQSFVKEDIVLGKKLEQRLVVLVPRRLVKFLNDHNITAFHTMYESLKSVLARVVRWSDLIALRAHRDHNIDTSVIPDTVLDDYDLVHIPLKQHCAPFKRARNKMLVTVHDLTHLYFPGHHSPRNIANAQEGLDFIDKKDADVIAISQSTKDDLLKFTSLPGGRIHLIYQAVDRRKFNFKINQDDCRKIRTKYGLNFDVPYIVCLSTLEPRKNLINTIQAYISLREEYPDTPLKLVIAGKKGWNAGNIFTAARDYADHIFFTGFIDDDDLAYLYSGAVAMSYLSFYEGFGLPPLEAMSCGTPVIYGNNSSLIEVVGAGGLPADPSDVTDIKNQFETIFYNVELRKVKSNEALKQSLKFSARKAAIQTLALYEEIIDNHRSP